MYTIYRITAPSGRCYIGLTKNALEERWRQHVNKALCGGYNHPFYNALRKHGFEAFCVEQIDTAASKSDAQRKEMFHIAAHAPRVYNLTAGGEADGAMGMALFWARLRKNPASLAAYLSKLSETKLALDWSDYTDMSAKAQAWRKANPRAAYKASRRASRIAAKSAAHAESPPARTLKEVLLWKHKREVPARTAALNQWAARGGEERAAIGARISSTAKERWAGVTDKGLRSEATAAARAAIDRSKQAPAASAGLKAYWAALKADPVRYREHISRRTETLKATLASAK